MNIHEEGEVSYRRGARVISKRQRLLLSLREIPGVAKIIIYKIRNKSRKVVQFESEGDAGVATQKIRETLIKFGENPLEYTIQAQLKLKL